MQYTVCGMQFIMYIVCNNLGEPKQALVLSPDPTRTGLVTRNRKVWLRMMNLSFTNQIQER